MTRRIFNRSWKITCATEENTNQQILKQWKSQYNKSTSSLRKWEQSKTKLAYSNLSKNRGSMVLKCSQHFTYLKVHYTDTENQVDLPTVALGVKSIISLLISGIFWKRITALKNQNVLVVANLKIIQKNKQWLYSQSSPFGSGRELKIEKLLPKIVNPEAGSQSGLERINRDPSLEVEKKFWTVWGGTTSF